MTGRGGRVMPIGEIGPCRAQHNVSNVLAAVAAGLLLGVAPDAIRGAVAGFTGRRASPGAGRRSWSGVLFVNDFDGNPARRGGRRARAASIRRWC